jgi:ABC-type nitrate/sulfonate/bicarbonate transport system substrate-binding protein
VRLLGIEFLRIPKKIGEIQTPWPCFIIVARSEVIEKSPELLKQFLAGTRESSQKFVVDSNNLQMISKTSKLSIDDSKKWLQEVKFSETNKVSKKILGDAVDILGIP